MTVHKRYVTGVKLARTVFAELIVTVHVRSFVLSHPVQEPKEKSVASVDELGVALMVTTVPAVNLPVQLTATVPPPVKQSTLPPVPAVAFSRYVVGCGGGCGGVTTLRVKLAVTNTRGVLPLVRTTQDPVFPQLVLDQPVNW